MIVKLISVSVLSAIFSVSAFQTSLQFRESSFSLRDQSFVSSTLGWAVGEPHFDQEQKIYRGTVIKTSDGAQSWEKLNVPVSRALNAVHFVDEMYGWVVSARGDILHTSDGGETWNEQALEISDELRGVYFLNRNLGFAVGAQRHSGVAPPENERVGVVYKTSDGGETWGEIDLPSNSAAMNRVFFLNQQEGWLAGVMNNTGAIFKTNDGGESWIVQHTSEEGNYFTSVFFTDSRNGWASSYNSSGAQSGPTAIKTSDGGDMWEEMDLNRNLRDIHFTDSLRGYAVGFRLGSAPPVFRTTDGGNSWQNLTINHHRGEGLFAVDVFHERMVSVGQRDFTCISNDPWALVDDNNSGTILTQIQLNPQYRFRGVHFEDRLRGWVVGIKLYIDRGTQVIMHTENGGESWYVIHETDTTCLGPVYGWQRLNDITFVDENNGWAVGYTGGEVCNSQNNSVLYTSDGGQTWEPVFNRAGMRILSVSATANGDVWVLPESRDNENSLIFHSSDFGSTWTSITMPHTDAINNGQIVFTESLRGWVVGGENGFVLYTDDAGENWHRRQEVLDNGFNTSIEGNVYAVSFPSQNIGWIGGSNLYQTTDGGESWNLRDIGFDGGDIASVYFTSENTGWVAGGNGVIMYTNDGGISWERESGTRPNHLQIEGMHFADDSTGWAVGGAGTIVRIDNSETSSIRMARNMGAENTFFSLRQRDYGVMAKINLDLNSHIKVEMVDLRGRVIKVAYNDRLNAGTHNLNIKTANLARGMYLLRLTKNRMESETVRFLISR
ncbi:BNR repeat protein [Chitinispirillum alkaliphilum]|nr:BNR repeat protein [Chitinispirillum alkaliphilum]